MKYIFFDLDGTITEPKVGITKSVAYALRHFDIETEDLNSLCKFIGPPLIQSFQEFYGFTEEQAKEAVKEYRVYYGKTGIFECSLYDGIKELLEHLYHQGKKVVLATSKPQEFAEKLLEHFNIRQYFDFVSGSTMDGSRVEKADIIQYAIDYYESSDVLFDLSQTIMIGDRKFDAIGAASFGIPCILVSYGYGEQKELEDCEPFAIKESALDVQKFLDTI